jgi:hypothetical protein
MNQGIRLLSLQITATRCPPRGGSSDDKLLQSVIRRDRHGTGSTVNDIKSSYMGLVAASHGTIIGGGYRRRTRDRTRGGHQCRPQNAEKTGPEPPSGRPDLRQQHAHRVQRIPVLERRRGIATWVTAGFGILFIIDPRQLNPPWSRTKLIPRILHSPSRRHSGPLRAG